LTYTVMHGSTKLKFDGVMFSRKDTTGHRNYRQTDITLQLASPFVPSNYRYISSQFPRAQRRIYQTWNEFRKIGTAGTVQRVITARSCNRRCGGKAMSITYCGCVFLDFGIQRAMRNAPCCHPWPAPLCSIFPTLSHEPARFSKKKKKCIEHKMGIWVSSTTFV